MLLLRLQFSRWIEEKPEIIFRFDEQGCQTRASCRQRKRQPGRPNIARLANEAGYRVSSCSHPDKMLSKAPAADVEAGSRVNEKAIVRKLNQHLVVKFFLMTVLCYIGTSCSASCEVSAALLFK